MRMIVLAYLAILFAGCAKSKEAPPIAPVLAKQLYAGEIVFIEHCSVCHNDSRPTIPKLAAPNPMVAGEKAPLISILTSGNTNHALELTDEEIADVLTFVRNSSGNNAGGISDLDVKAVRKP